MSYCLIIGDIKESKKISDRYAVQETFKNVLNEINVSYRNDIEVKFCITLGDEFQGIVNYSDL